MATNHNDGTWAQTHAGEIVTVLMAGLCAVYFWSTVVPFLRSIGDALKLG